MTEGRVKMRVLEGIPASGGVAIGKEIFLGPRPPKIEFLTLPRWAAMRSTRRSPPSSGRSRARSRSSSSRSRDGVTKVTSSERASTILSVHLALLEDYDARRAGTIRTIQLRTSSPRTQRRRGAADLLGGFQPDRGSVPAGAWTRPAADRPTGPRKPRQDRPVDSIAAIRDPGGRRRPRSLPGGRRANPEKPGDRLRYRRGKPDVHRDRGTCLRDPRSRRARGGHGRGRCRRDGHRRRRGGVVISNPIGGGESGSTCRGESSATSSWRRELLKLEGTSRRSPWTGSGCALRGTSDSPSKGGRGAIKRHGGDGVGLYRTEYLYLNRKDLPSEEEQTEAYRKVAWKGSPRGRRSFGRWTSGATSSSPTWTSRRR